MHHCERASYVWKITNQNSGFNSVVTAWVNAFFCRSFVHMHFVPTFNIRIDIFLSQRSLTMATIRLLFIRTNDMVINLLSDAKHSESVAHVQGLDV